MAEKSNYRPMIRNIKSLKNQSICKWCGIQAGIIWVHGHGQCANCGVNIDECCNGETCENSTFQANSNYLEQRNERK
jgi:hypothetical protein